MNLRKLAALSFVTLLLAATVALIVSGTPALATEVTTTGATTRVSTSSAGDEGNGRSDAPSISADGRYVAFSSEADNLVDEEDKNASSDVFVKDRVTGATEYVSVSSDGILGNDDSFHPSISGDGRYVAFYSDASNLVSDDSNGARDVFVHDRQTGDTTRVSVASDGTQGNDASTNPSISANGNFVAFQSRANNLVALDTNVSGDIFVHDLTTGDTSRVSVASDGSEANSHSFNPSISGDGQIVTFDSVASNLVADDTEGYLDVFVHDRGAGTTMRVSVASDATPGNGTSWFAEISADAGFVTYYSAADNLVPGDTNDAFDVFVYNRAISETTRISVATNGTQGNGESRTGSISADGRYVVFASYASNLVSGDNNAAPDIFVRDRMTGATSRVSVATDGSEGNGPSLSADVSGQGRFVAFASGANNLVAADSNGAKDVFAHDQAPDYGVQLSGDQAKQASPNTVAAYTLVMTNTGALIDVFDLTLTSSSWSTAIDGPSTVVLAGGASAEVTVLVTVPSWAGEGESDTVALIATSEGEPTKYDSAYLTTTSFLYYMYLPSLQLPTQEEPQPQP